jgi:hypothetical protein
MTERKRFKSTDELSPGEHLLLIRAKRRGQPVPKFEAGAYSKAKIAALKDAGLDQEAAELEEAQEKTEPKSPAGHLAHIRRQHAAPGRSPRAA